MEDGKNFSPASAFTAFSHQFSSICGAGPVTGTIVAMAFGWLPVVLWVLVGGIFFGAVHDFGALYASMKNLSLIHILADECPDILVGAGTVVNLEQCKRAVEAGAKFIVSPGYDEQIIDWCLENEVNLVPGGVTPAELTYLINRGFDITKFFPANLYGGLKALEALAAVFVGHRFMPTGGVSTDNVREFLGSKAIIAAGGTWMVKPNLFADGDFSRVEALAAEAAAAVQEVRG